jgi:hypothetical protein
MPDNYSITLTDQPNLNDVKFVEDGLATYNLQSAPPYNTRRLVVLLRAADVMRHFLQKELSPS